MNIETTSVINLVKDFIDLIKCKCGDQCILIIFFVIGGEVSCFVVPLEPSTKKKLGIEVALMFQALSRCTFNESRKSYSIDML